MNRKAIIYGIVPFESARGATAYKIFEEYCARSGEDIRDSFTINMSRVSSALRQMVRKGLIKRSVAFVEVDGEDVGKYVYSKGHCD